MRKISYIKHGSKVATKNIFSGGIIFLVILISLLSAYNPSHALAVSTWDGIGSSTDWIGGGTRDDPYVISTAAQLKGLADSVNDGTPYSGTYFKFDNDIDFANHAWTPIGGHCPIEDGIPNGPYFAGAFDGGNHTISGINISNPVSETGAYGLFGYVKDGVIANLNATVCWT